MQTFPRVPFELPGDAPFRAFPIPSNVGFSSAEDDDILVPLMTAAFAVGSDPRDDLQIKTHGAAKVATAMLQDALFGGTYKADRRWWSVVEFDGLPAGFVLPVVFAGCERDGMDEGTIYHIGVTPTFRTKGLGRLLLARGTDTLLTHGVWQISADTAAENEPMIALFESQRWARRPQALVGSHPLPELD